MLISHRKRLLNWNFEFSFFHIHVEILEQIFNFDLIYYLIVTSILSFRLWTQCRRVTFRRQRFAI